MFSIIEAEFDLRLEDGIHLSKYGHRKLSEKTRENSYYKFFKFHTNR